MDVLLFVDISQAECYTVGAASLSINLIHVVQYRSVLTLLLSYERTVMRKTRTIAAALAGAALLGAPLHAAPVNDYRGPDKGDWNTVGSWSTGAVPNGANGLNYDVTSASTNTVVHSSSSGSNGVDLINSLNFTNTGGLVLSGGIIAGAQANQGSLFSVSGPLLINGGSLRNFTLINSDAVNFAASGSSDGNTLDAMTLSGGLKISNAVVNISSSFTYGQGATFDLSNNGKIGFQLNQTLANATLKEGGYSSLVSVDSSHTLTLDKTLTVSGINAAFNGGKVVSNTLLSSTQGGQWNATPTSFTNNATAEAQGSGSTFSISSGQFYNTGTFQAIGGSALAQATTFVNTGTIQALGGGSVTIKPYAYNYNANALGTVTASGMGSRINLAGGTLVLGRGEKISAANGGVINLQTTLDNTGNTFDPLAYGSAGAFVVSGGTISGGSIANSDTLHFASNITSILQNAAISGGLNLATSQDSGGSVQIQGAFSHGTGALFNLGRYGVLTFAGSYTFDNATVNFAAPTSLGITNGTLTLGPHLILQGGRGIIGPYVGAGGTLINQTTIAASGSSPAFGLNTFSIQTRQATNQGTIRADNGGYLLVSSSTIFTNAGTVTVTGGSLLAAPSFAQTAGQTVIDGQANISPLTGAGTLGGTITLQAGSLSGTGNISGAVSNPGGTVRPGDPLGTLTISNTYAQGTKGTFLEQIGGTDAGQFGVLSVGSLATLNGTLDVSLANGFLPTVGQTFTFLDYGSLSGAFSSVVGLDSGYGYSVAYGSSNAILTVTSVAAAPEPSPGTTFAIGLLSLGGLLFARKRCAIAA